MKFIDGYMKKSGHAAKEYVDRAYRNLELKSGVMGIKVAIMLPMDPTGQKGPKNPLPDVIKVMEPKLETLPLTPTATKGQEPEADREVAEE